MKVYIVSIEGYEEHTVVGITNSESVARAMVEKLEPFREERYREVCLEEFELHDSADNLHVRKIFSRGSLNGEPSRYTNTEWTWGAFELPGTGIEWSAVDNDAYVWAPSEEEAERLYREAGGKYYGPDGEG